MNAKRLGISQAELAGKKLSELTDRQARNYPIRDSVHRVWDSTVKGLHLRITPAGARSYCVAFQRSDGKKVNVTLGAAIDLKLEEVREKAAALRKMHMEGADARAYVQQQREAKDLNYLLKIWEQDYRSVLKPSTRASYDSIIRAVLVPALGTRLIKSLSYEDVKAIHRSQRAKGNLVNANRAIAVLSRLLSIAEIEDMRPTGSNPCMKLEKTKEKPRQRVFSVAELAGLETAIVSLVNSEKLDPAAGDLIRFLAYSGLRRGEALRLKFSDVDLDRGAMRFDDHKTDGSAGVKTLPLNSHLRDIVRRRAEEGISPYVFRGWKLNRPIVGLEKMWTRVMVEVKLDPPATPHDLRRTFMSTCTDLGYPLAIGDALLGHSLGKIRDTYVHLGTEGIMATASQETADWIHGAMNGVAVKPGQKVLKEKDVESDSA